MVAGSPFLFAIYVNDVDKQMYLSDSVRRLTTDTLTLFVLHYADDPVIFLDTCAGLQQGMDTLYEFKTHLLRCTIALAVLYRPHYRPKCPLSGQMMETLTKSVNYLAS